MGNGVFERLHTCAPASTDNEPCATYFSLHDGNGTFDHVGGFWPPARFMRSFRTANTSSPQRVGRSSARLFPDLTASGRVTETTCQLRQGPLTRRQKRQGSPRSASRVPPPVASGRPLAPCWPPHAGRKKIVVLCVQNGVSASSRSGHGTTLQNRHRPRKRYRCARHPLPPGSDHGGFYERHGAQTGLQIITPDSSKGTWPIRLHPPSTRSTKSRAITQSWLRIRHEPVYLPNICGSPRDGKRPLKAHTIRSSSTLARIA